MEFAAKDKVTLRTNEPDRRIELIGVDQLIPQKANPRTHSRKHIRQIAKSIERFGFVNPVIIDDGSHIIAGHGRVEAAKQLGLTAIPTLRLSNLSAAEVRAYVIADNRLAELSGWDREILATELQGLIDLDFDVELTGFDMGEIDILLEDGDEARREGAGREDDIPDPVPDPAISRAGDLWILGNHRLLCGDARYSEAYATVLGGEKAQLVFTDLQHSLRRDGEVCGFGAIQHSESAMASGEMSSDEFTGFLKTVFRQLVAHTIDGSIHYLCADWRHVLEMMLAGNEAYGELENVCARAKTNAGTGSIYRCQHELIFVWKSGDGPPINNAELGQHGRNRSNLWTCAGVNTMRPGRLEELAMHPTVKPVDLVADAIRDTSRRNAIILDPFMGAGTTMIAAEQTGRRARGLEIDPVHVDVAIRRWQSHSGKSATLAATGQTFEQVAEERHPANPVDRANDETSAPPVREVA